MTTSQPLIQDNNLVYEKVPFDEAKRRDYLRIQIITDSNCNLACDYCVLLYKDQAYKEERALSDQTSDAYIDFFSSNYDEIMKYYRGITITFFWWEPLLSPHRFLKIMRALIKFENINFVIHTNWTLLSQKIIDDLQEFPKDKFSFIVSIDGDVDIMMKYRLRSKLHFYKIVYGMKLLRKNGIHFLVSPSIMKPKAQELYKNYVYLHNLQPDGIIINPVTAVYNFRELESSKQIVKGIRMFFNYLRNEKNYSDFEIIQFFWMPLDIYRFKDYLKFWLNITWDIDGTVHAMSFAWQWFDDGSTYTKEDLRWITLWNVLFNIEHLRRSFFRYGLYTDEKIWEIAYRQQRKWTMPDWDVQNMLAAMILRYFKGYYSKNNKRKRCE